MSPSAERSSSVVNGDGQGAVQAEEVKWDTLTRIGAGLGVAIRFGIAAGAAWIAWRVGFTSGVAASAAIGIAVTAILAALNSD